MRRRIPTSSCSAAFDASLACEVDPYLSVSRVSDLYPRVVPLVLGSFLGNLEVSIKAILKPHGETL